MDLRAQRDILERGRSGRSLLNGRTLSDYMFLLLGGSTGRREQRKEYFVKLAKRTKKGGLKGV